MSVIAEYQSLVKKTTDVNLGGKKLFLSAKTILPPPFFPRKKTLFFTDWQKPANPAIYCTYVLLLQRRIDRRTPALHCKNQDKTKRRKALASYSPNIDDLVSRLVALTDFVKPLYLVCQ